MGTTICSIPSSMKAFVVFLLNSKKVRARHELNLKYIKIKSESDIFPVLRSMDMEFSHSTYFVVVNDEIRVKNMLGSSLKYTVVDNIDQYLNVTVYSANKLPGFDVEIAKNTTEAYELEMQKDHISRKGYFLYVNTDRGFIYCVCISRNHEFSDLFEFSQLDDNLTIAIIEANRKEFDDKLYIDLEIESLIFQYI
ncbi:uncharacterized protein CANTADRAFT_24727 [Suhomyces tanzawaensis NRRL Y-17324]|uniref:Uncharacterized protein n=1 Tax=Suhomyces tanzawaensis NRRL Y-17324 TaxID=984487 RepID=A0A1E4SRB9_9ASCO|nr:uncharacterized protein CANTADRAFT_24727 [Suhomyces tanzawaensis NRRL Y-17324]ODV82045.1 hypothetical protein CANTADRAFT_24727 [Suhomyces tanzawaensis NRRL Y-17324]